MLTRLPARSPTHHGQDTGDKAYFGFESAPQSLQEAHLSSMFRASVARRKAPKKAAEFIFTEKELDMFEAGYIQRQTEDDFDEFISQADDKTLRQTLVAHRSNHLKSNHCSRLLRSHPWLDLCVLSTISALYGRYESVRSALNSHEPESLS